MNGDILKILKKYGFKRKWNMDKSGYWYEKLYRPYKFLELSLAVEERYITVHMNKPGFLIEAIMVDNLTEKRLLKVLKMFGEKE
jgi:hypothetical protein